MFKNIKHNLIGLLIEIGFAAALVLIGLLISLLFGFTN
jgi:F0F1-type ATP synthase membrane subunit c/vacuolar-type H+-ATPase subunit K